MNWTYAQTLLMCLRRTQCCCSIKNWRRTKRWKLVWFSRSSLSRGFGRKCRRESTNIGICLKRFVSISGNLKVLRLSFSTSNLNIFRRHFSAIITWKLKRSVRIMNFYSKYNVKPSFCHAGVCTMPCQKVSPFLLWANNGRNLIFEKASIFTRFSSGGIPGALVLGGLEIPHDYQQSHIVLLAPHQNWAKQGRRCSHSTWSLDDIWAAFPWV